MKFIQGDLIALARQNQFDVIVHGCNCFCAMGAGIAKTIRQVFPEAYDADCATQKGDKTKLGSCSHASCKINGGQCVVINAYTQYHWAGRGVKVEYEAVRQCMKWIKQNYAGKKIGLPKIGAGLAGGDWQTIESIISEELAGEDVTIVSLIAG